MDPTAFIAPPRTEYDYSPLDLAPPSQRRRRQLIAGAIGALSVVLLGALLVFGWILLREEDDEPPGQQAAVTTETAAQNQAATPPAGSEGTAPPATEASAAEPTAATQPTQAAAPTEPPAAAGAPGAEELRALLPDASQLPPGFDAGADNERDFAGVVEALGGSRIAEQNLQQWGWTANVERVFNVADPAAADPTSATNITVSLHGFRDAAAATEALPFYSDILVNLGYEDLDPPPIGQHARLLRQSQEDGGMNVAFYVQQGPVLYRIGGYAPASGDPTQAVIDVASAMLAGQ